MHRSLFAVYNLSAHSTGLALQLWFVKCFMHLSPFGGLLLHEICKRSCPTVTICLAPPSKWRFNLRFGILNTCICCCVVCWDWKMKFWLLVTSRSFYLFEMGLYAFNSDVLLMSFTLWRQHKVYVKVRLHVKNIWNPNILQGYNCVSYHAVAFLYWIAVPSRS